MDDGFLPGLFIGILVSFTVFFILGYFVGFLEGYKVAMTEAFERGHAVQCLGKEGYFWGCEE